MFLVGSLALVGIPPFAGFFSKDSIIAAQLDPAASFGYFLFAACLAGAFLTGLYTFRLFFIVFGGEKSEFAQEHLHEPHGRLEGPLSMVWTVGDARRARDVRRLDPVRAVLGADHDTGSTRSPRR